MPYAVPSHLASVADARALFGMIADARREIAVIAYLAADHRLIGLDYVVGTRDSVEVAPRLVVSGALRHGARQVVMAHNHPSGDPRPSPADLAHARRLAQALHPIEVRLADQLILAGPATISLRALGLL
ncbi:JAB domain-containing protein [Sphingomonas sp.]|uniref:JAB domain-containing protein n=1 Tax=Sphingomonas sp. TaxID=28214 RepID=UPI002CAADB74|nr:JAB domain-containing protein [Sphingomonas sp.]HWK35148.1 JAB domain-containing protein [Sphingomonas sp.]